MPKRAFLRSFFATEPSKCSKSWVKVPSRPSNFAILVCLKKTHSQTVARYDEKQSETEETGEGTEREVLRVSAHETRTPARERRERCVTSHTHTQITLHCCSCSRSLCSLKPTTRPEAAQNNSQVPAKQSQTKQHETRLST